jgi:hypothetical protein
MDEVWESVGGHKVTRNSIALLMQRTPADSAKNICSVVHVFLDAAVSPSRPDSGAQMLLKVATRDLARNCLAYVMDCFAKLLSAWHQARFLEKYDLTGGSE